MTVCESLRKELRTINAELSLDDYSRCIRHLELVRKWNQSMNLTSVRTFDDMLSKHLFDSLSIVEHIADKPRSCRQRIADLGSGAGFPGIPIAMALPNSHVVLVDASAKKTQFLTHVAAQLNLANVEVVHQRIQDMSISRRFDTVVARALGSVRAIVKLSAHLAKSDSRILVMKGRYPMQEIKELGQQFDCAVKNISVPRLDAKRHLVIITRKKKKKERVSDG